MNITTILRLLFLWRLIFPGGGGAISSLQACISHQVRSHIVAGRNRQPPTTQFSQLGIESPSRSSMRAINIDAM